MRKRKTGDSKRRRKFACTKRLAKGGKSQYSTRHHDLYKFLENRRMKKVKHCANDRTIFKHLSNSLTKNRRDRPIQKVVDVSCRRIDVLKNLPDEILISILLFVPVDCIFLKLQFVTRYFYEVIHKKNILFRIIYERTLKRKNSFVQNQTKVDYKRMLFQKFVRRKHQKRYLTFTGRRMEVYGGLYKIVLKRPIDSFSTRKGQMKGVELEGVLSNERGYEVLKIPYFSSLERVITKYKLSVCKVNKNVDCVEISSRNFSKRVGNVISFRKVKKPLKLNCPHLLMRKEKDKGTAWYHDRYITIRCRTCGNVMKRVEIYDKEYSCNQIRNNKSTYRAFSVTTVKKPKGSKRFGTRQKYNFV